MLNLLLLSGAGAMAYQYRERLMQWYLTWRGKADIVFFGDSITAQGDWNILLKRCDIKNSGIPGLGVVHLKDEVDRYVLAFSPKICVVMGGINDLTILERSVAETVRDYESTLSVLKEANIHTIVQLTLQERQSPAIRLKVDSLNRWLTQYCDSINLTVVDPNIWLSDQTGLKKGFARDRTHLTKEAYQVWARNLAPFLQRKLR